MRPLAAADAARIRQIFAWQAEGRLDLADRAIRALGDRSLLADILADRDHAAAGARPDPAVPARAGKPRPSMKSGPAAEEADQVEAGFSRNRLLDRTIAARLAEGASGARSALRLVAQTRFSDLRYAATLRAAIAQVAFTSGDDALALRTARSAMAQSAGQVGLAGYVAGLASWRQGRIEAARDAFEQASRGSLTAAGTRAGAAFWAARAHRRLGDEAGAAAWLRRAAVFSHTFYGMLAQRVLGTADRLADRAASPAAERAPIVNGGDFSQAVLGEADLEAVAATGEGRRAFALLQVGQDAHAEEALRRLWPLAQGDAALCRSIALVAQAAGMTSLAGQLAAVLQEAGATPSGSTGFPVPRLRPRRGFTVNPALVYALTRLESNFNARAVSGAGAHGLMQIMPVTANFVLGTPDQLRNPARALHDPSVNLDVGQRYLTYLARQNSVDGDLIRLLASYNAGPGALAGWTAPPTDDPLLFIETLPVRETRDFVHRALSYLWIYAARMDLPTPSLDALAEGEWPRFDDEQKMASARPKILLGAR